jgi:hypothetical protein
MSSASLYCVSSIFSFENVCISFVYHMNESGRNVRSHVEPYCSVSILSKCEEKYEKG